MLMTFIVIMQWAECFGERPNRFLDSVASCTNIQPLIYDEHKQSTITFISLESLKRAMSDGPELEGKDSCFFEVKLHTVDI